MRSSSRRSITTGQSKASPDARPVGQPFFIARRQLEPCAADGRQSIRATSSGRAPPAAGEAQPSQAGLPRRRQAVALTCPGSLTGSAVAGPSASPRPFHNK